jgi:uncharacterized protein YlxW (UPF0749 family)
MNLRSWQVPTTIVFLFLGIILSTQFKAQQIINSQLLRDSSKASEKKEVVIKLIKVRDNQQKQLNSQLEDLKGQIKSYENLASQKLGVVAGISKEIDKYRLLTGTTEVRGPGIIITIDDPKDEVTNVPIGDGLLPEELVELIDILRYSGAEAISVNSQRVVSYTSIVIAGKNIMVNGDVINRTTSPTYDIVAIGPGTLADSVAQTSDLVETLKSYGCKVNIVKQQNLRIPAFAGRTFKYAKPAINNLK